MVFRQFIHDDLGCASYVVADEDAGVAATVGIRSATGLLAGGMTSGRLEGRPVQRITSAHLQRLRERRDRGLVQRLGVGDVLRVAGRGVPGWIRAGYESESSARTGAGA